MIIFHMLSSSAAQNTLNRKYIYRLELNSESNMLYAWLTWYNWTGWEAGLYTNHGLELFGGFYNCNRILVEFSYTHFKYVEASCNVLECVYLKLLGQNVCKKILKQAGLHTYSQSILRSLIIWWFKYCCCRTENITQNLFSPEK